ncbi:hypothetical protein HAHE_21540 [Haloferula helveola]|uniref:Trypsin-like peptidase domain-containing protein n=1 Tax=Haloferula helveola TaxID=490095 RepID=A0ABN6H3R8_9BACT|nr:hypothetical protein HAHE_21540 [Haloferula helveola]
MIRILTAALLSTSGLAMAASGELHATATKLTETHRDAVVWISVVAKITMSAEGDVPDQIKAQLAGQEQETTAETTGTFISSDGMLVTALAQLDQSTMVDGKTVNTPMGAIKLNAKSEIREIKVIMPDGTEIPGDLVLKDADLGLGFIKMRMDSDEAQGVEISSIDLADSAEGKLLDDCVALGRLDESFQREPSVVTTEISGITTRPRMLYRVGTDSIGSPVFLGNGKLLGISVFRKPAGDLDAKTKLAPVILPAAEVAKLAEQAKAAKPVETAPAEDSEEG